MEWASHILVAPCLNAYVVLFLEPRYILKCYGKVCMTHWVSVLPLCPLQWSRYSTIRCPTVPSVTHKEANAAASHTPLCHEATGQRG